jgi:hypothetical protein
VNILQTATTRAEIAADVAVHSKRTLFYRELPTLALPLLQPWQSVVESG